VFITTKSATRTLILLRDRRHTHVIKEEGSCNRNYNSCNGSELFWSRTSCNKDKGNSHKLYNKLLIRQRQVQWAAVRNLHHFSQQLVSKGTITQAQADAITAAHAAAEAAREAARPLGGKGGFDQKLTVHFNNSWNRHTNSSLTPEGWRDNLLQLQAIRRQHSSQHLLQMRQSESMLQSQQALSQQAQATTLKANLTAHVTAEVEATAPLGGKGGS